MFIPLPVFATTQNYNQLSNQKLISHTKEKNDLETIEYVEKRDKLIEKYGIEEAYKILGLEKINEKIKPLKRKETVNLDSVIYSVTSPDDGGYSYRTHVCFDQNNQYFANMKMATYKNYSINRIDIVYEVEYVYGHKAGYLYYDDLIGCNVAVAYHINILNTPIQ